MKHKHILRYAFWGVSSLLIGCKVPALNQENIKVEIPNEIISNSDSTQNIGKIHWKNFFKDPYLQALIDTALLHNQELHIVLQELEISKNEIQAKRGEYLPFVGLIAGAGADKLAKHTREGAVEHGHTIKKGKEIPDVLPDIQVAAVASWELDVWKKLRNAQKAQVNRYLSTVEGKHFLVTELIGEIAEEYYTLLALDKQLEIANQNIELQSSVLRTVKLLKNSTRETELAVTRFEAQVLKTQALQYEILQKITETENRINFLLGRYPQNIARAKEDLIDENFAVGSTQDLLNHRPDIKRSELELAALKLDVEVAKARFYPSFGISAGLGLQSFSPVYLVKPASILFNLAADMAMPLINKWEIKANYANANAKQIQGLLGYQQTVLDAFMDVRNHLSQLQNLENRLKLKQEEVETLNRSVEVSNKLFANARADYMEVLLTQREALDVKFECVETELEQVHARIGLYKALGGGWN